MDDQRAEGGVFVHPRCGTRHRPTEVCPDDPYRGCEVYERHGACVCSTGYPASCTAAVAPREHDLSATAVSADATPAAHVDVRPERTV